MAVDIETERRIQDLEKTVELLTSTIRLLDIELSLLKNEGCWIHKQKSAETGIK